MKADPTGMQAEIRQGAAGGVPGRHSKIGRAHRRAFFSVIYTPHNKSRRRIRTESFQEWRQGHVLPFDIVSLLLSRLTVASPFLATFIWGVSFWFRAFSITSRFKVLIAVGGGGFLKETSGRWSMCVGCLSPGVAYG